MTDQEQRIWDAVYAAEFQWSLAMDETNRDIRYPWSLSRHLENNARSAAERALVRADEAVLRLRETAPHHKSRI